MSRANGADLGFEQEIWKAADVLRGNMDASEYKHVVLGLIFLKYIRYLNIDTKRAHCRMKCNKQK